jgi:septum formation protein
MAQRLILASASPRRRELLAQAGFVFEVQPAEIDETPLPDEPAAAYVVRLAMEKAQAVFASCGDPEARVLAADTSVVLTGGSILGKPLHAADAARMLGQLSGRTHAVMTGLAAVDARRAVSAIEITQVFVDLIRADEIEAYVAGGEPLDKAGAYAIQGYAARWIPRIEGDYFNVVGLPIARTVALLRQLHEPEAGFTPE